MYVDDIPMAFRAQIEPRCQIHRINPDLKGDQARRNDAYIWVREWLNAASKKTPKFSPRVNQKRYDITWRFVTNGGQDEGVIRPVMGAQGVPFYPGSSMKGAFCCAWKKCFPEDMTGLTRYCGGTLNVNGIEETKPGILRFHGAFPVNQNWRNENIVDLVHPQEDWQVKDSGNHSAFFMISLLKPTLNFGISCTETLSESEWNTIWEVWETALGYGIGSRVSAGYGHIDRHDAAKILSVSLKGDGLISKRIDGSSEFRPNMFKAALRGHTMRLLGGVTEAATAERLTKKLWGGFNGNNGSIVGELGIAFSSGQLYEGGGWVPPFRLTQGKLDILALKTLGNQRRQDLSKFTEELLKFSMLLGGFGKSWRRASHAKFYSDDGYVNRKNHIGVHWRFCPESESFYIPFKSVDSIRTYFQNLRQTVRDWVQNIEGERLNQNHAPWREAWAWDRDRVQVWARFCEATEPTGIEADQNAAQSNAAALATGNSSSSAPMPPDDELKATSLALDWLHDDRNHAYSLKQTHLSGQMGRIGRIWHRMYPRFTKDQNGGLSRQGFIEFLTIFPEPQPQGEARIKQNNFLQFLNQQSDFKRVL
jgi:CRISPR-associated protein Cmr6